MVGCCCLHLIWVLLSPSLLVLNISIISGFCCPQHLRVCAVPRIAKEDHEFYQMLLNNTATACQPPSILTLFLDGEVSPALRVTPAIDTVKAVFKHLEDPEAGREFFATTFEDLQVCSALTCCEQSACLSCLRGFWCHAVVSSHGKSLEGPCLRRLPDRPPFSLLPFSQQLVQLYGMDKYCDGLPCVLLCMVTAAMRVAVLCCAMPCCAVPCTCASLCCAVLCCAMLCCAVLCYAVQCPCAWLLFGHCHS